MPFILPEVIVFVVFVVVELLSESLRRDPGAGGASGDEAPGSALRKLLVMRALVAGSAGWRCTGAGAVSHGRRGKR